MDEQEFNELSAQYETTSNRRLRASIDALASLVEDGSVDEKTAAKMLKFLISKHVYGEIKEEMYDELTDSFAPRSTMSLKFLRFRYDRKETIKEHA